MISARSLGVPELSRFVNNADSGANTIGTGGAADVYLGLFQPSNGPALKVAIKTIRTESYSSPPESLLAKSRRKLSRELGVWRTLQGELGHPNVLRLLGVIDSPIGLPSSHLTDPENKPRRIQLLVGTLRGLAYIHEASVVHGDLKGVNILVTHDGTPKICDFGHARFVTDTTNQGTSDMSSQFHATTRYMSPELFNESQNKPTIFSDIWAYGCVALEILSQLRPYHVIKNTHRVTLAIKAGRPPSFKPSYPHAASCLNDLLWDVIKACWHPHHLSRPTSAKLLATIDELIERGQVDSVGSASPIRPNLRISGEMAEWPPGIEDLADILSGFDKRKISARGLADVWLCSRPAGMSSTAQEDPLPSRFAVKVLRVPTSLATNGNPTVLLQQALRVAVRERISIQHQNVVELIGIDTSWGKCPGLVMEYCEGGTLENYLNRAFVDDTLIELRCMAQILDGLQFFRTLPSPLSHGDLTPHNILVDIRGTLKLSLISFARITANVPSDVQPTSPVDNARSARYLSPDILQENGWSSPHSDMWSFGCVACWMYVRIDPYPNCDSEHLVIPSILDGNPPYTINQISNMGPLGGRHVMPDSPWLTNGTFALIIRCWNQEGHLRPSATTCAKHLRELLDGAERDANATLQDFDRLTSISTDVTNLSGLVNTLEEDRKHTLKYSIGTWRRLYGYNKGDPVELRYRCWKGIMSRGFLWRKTEVVIKIIVLPPGLHSGGVILDSAKQSIHHEIALLRQLKHGNICQFWGYDDLHGGTVSEPCTPAIITEFCPNGNLNEYCSRRSNELRFEERLELVKGVANGLSYLHQGVSDGSVVHGNLSMESVLVNQKGAVKITGFEFACQYEHSDNPLLARLVYPPRLDLSPSRWHAPELFLHAVDPVSPCPTQYSDLWALGCIFLTVLCGQVPYEGYDLPSAIGAITTGTLPYSQDVCSAQAWNTATLLWADPPQLRISAEQAENMISIL